jgi:hypothetical protein
LVRKLIYKQNRNEEKNVKKYSLRKKALKESFLRRLSNASKGEAQINESLLKEAPSFTKKSTHRFSSLMM